MSAGDIASDARSSVADRSDAPALVDGPDEGTRLTHLPALDGLRGVAVAAVLAFHGRLPWARGGFLGVTSFFVLSGFLITGLLLAERDRTGSIRLGTFWVRRARRLAPAILVTVALVLAYVAFGAGAPTPGVLGDALAALAWVSNWRFVIADQSYAAMFSAPTPFQHMWSLAVEEQFYLVFPLAAVLLLGRRGPPRRWWFGAVTVGAIIASTAAAAVLHPAGAGPGRAYYGTDARIAEPLVGVLLALVLVGSGGRRVLGQVGRRALDALAVVASIGLAWMVATLTERSDFLYRGGFLLAAVLTAVVIAAATQPGSFAARVLSARPLTSLGLVSYGVYLYHWPIFLWVNARRTGLNPLPLLGLRFSITLAAAVASYILVEQPVRRGRINGRVAAIAWAPAATGLLAAFVLVVGVPSVSTPVVAVDGVAVEPSPVAGVTEVTSVAEVARARPRPAKSPTGSSVPASRPGAMAAGRTPAKKPAAPPPTPGGAAFAFQPGPVKPAPAPPPSPPSPGASKPPLKVAVVGDSMAEGLAWGLETWAKARGDVVVYNLTIRACPMSPGGGDRRLADGGKFGISEACPWWTDPKSDRSVKLAEFDPDVVVSQDGMNELFERKLPSWSSYRKAGQLQFNEWLKKQYNDMARALTAQGAELLLVNAVCADWENMGTSFAGYADFDEGDRRIKALNSITSTLDVPRVTSVDMQAHLCPNGSYRQSVDGVDDARPDGYHLSRPGADALATKWLGPLVLQSFESPSSEPPGMVGRGGWRGER